MAFPGLQNGLLLEENTSLCAALERKEAAQPCTPHQWALPEFLFGLSFYPCSQQKELDRCSEQILVDCCYGFFFWSLSILKRKK